MTAARSGDVDMRKAGVLDSLDRALRAMNRYDHLVASKAELSTVEDREVTEAHIDMHTATMDLFRRLAPAIQREYPEVWHGDEETDQYVLCEFDNGEKLVGIKPLFRYQGAVREERVPVESRHANLPDKTVERAALLPPAACRRAVFYFNMFVGEQDYADELIDREVIHDVGRSKNDE